MLALTFYAFSAIVIAVISLAIWELSPTKTRNKTLLFPITIFLFQLTIGLIGETGFYINYSLPPPFVYAGILPAFVLLASFSFSKTGKLLLKSIPLHYPILFQSFRIIVELLIFWTYLKGWGPKEATMIGYNYEFYFGILALIVGFLTWRGKLSKKLLIGWNVFGLLMLAFIVGIFITSAFAYDTFWGNSDRMVTDEMFQMPVMAIATLYMPLAVWTHIFSIRQNILRES